MNGKATAPAGAAPAVAPGLEFAPPEDRLAEIAQARRLAERYRLEFVDMDHFLIDNELFRSIPADLMLRYGFVPYRREGRSLVIVVSELVTNSVRHAGIAAEDPIELHVTGDDRGVSVSVHDGGPGSGKTPDAIVVDPVEVLRPGGTMTIDDYTPANSWPPTWCRAWAA